jgi:hypothetical protein
MRFIDDVRRDALFASALQRSDTPTPDVVSGAIRLSLRRLGRRGCVALVAQEFGDHPEAAAERMHWVGQVIAQAPAA